MPEALARGTVPGREGKVFGKVKSGTRGRVWGARRFVRDLAWQMFPVVVACLVLLIVWEVSYPGTVAGLFEGGE